MNFIYLFIVIHLSNKKNLIKKCFKTLLNSVQRKENKIQKTWIFEKKKRKKENRTKRILALGIKQLPSSPWRIDHQWDKERINLSKNRNLLTLGIKQENKDKQLNSNYTHHLNLKEKYETQKEVAHYTVHIADQMHELFQFLKFSITRTKIKSTEREMKMIHYWHVAAMHAVIISWLLGFASKLYASPKLRRPQWRSLLPLNSSVSSKKNKKIFFSLWLGEIEVR